MAFAACELRAASVCGRSSRHMHRVTCFVRHFAPRSGSPTKGFTLVELLIVIVIVALIVSVTVASFGNRGDDAVVANEAQRLTALIELARERAELEDQEWGLDVEATGYAFLTFDSVRGVWSRVRAAQFRPRDLPAALSITLQVDALEVVAAPEGRAAEQSRRAGERNVRASEDARQPDVLLLSSGEVSQFNLRIGRTDGPRNGTSGVAWQLGSDGVAPVRAQALANTR